MSDDAKPWVTADGVRVGPGDRVYWFHNIPGPHVVEVDAKWCSMNIDSSWSTRALAIQAERDKTTKRYQSRMAALDKLDA